VQKFALRVCCKQWDTAYSELLSWSNVYLHMKIVVST